MHRLSGIEAGFLAYESATQNANMGYVLTFPPNGGPTVSVVEVRDHIEARLDLLPSLRWCLLKIPFGLHHPVLIDDPEFDLDHHLHSVTLVDVDNPDALNRLVAAATRRPLDRRHPLWNLTLVRGDGEELLAMILVAHHVLGDGVALTTTVNLLFNDDLSDQQFVPVPWRPEQPARMRLVVDAVVDRFKLSLGLPRLLVDTRRGFRAQRRRVAVTTATGDAQRTPSQRAPMSSQYSLSPFRVFARSELDLSDFRLVRQAASVTLNDVLMAVVGISLRRYLVSRDELPATSLVSGVMVSTEPLGVPARQSGNHFANFITSLATDMEDPWEQLRAISAAGAEAKLRLEMVGLEIPQRWLEMIPPVIAVPMARRDAARRRTHPELVRASIIVSNMRGNPPFRFRDTTVEGMYAVGQVLDAIGVFVVGNSSGDRFNMTILSNPTALDRPDELVAIFKDVLAELVSLATPQATATSAAS